MVRRLFALIVVLLLCGVSVVSAREMLQADRCTVAATETIEGNLFVACRWLEVEGTVTGDLIGAAANATIRGAVEGSVYLAGGQLDIFGSIGGDIHFAGAVLNVQSGAVIDDGDLFSFTLSTATSNSQVGSVVASGYQLNLGGNVAGEVNFWGSALTISGRVGGSVDASVGDPQSAGVAELRTLLTPTGLELTNPGLYVADGGMIAGQLTYTGPVEAEILPDLPREPIYHPVMTQGDLTNLAEGENLTRSLSAYALEVLREFITVGLVGLLALLLFQRTLQAPIPTLRLRPLPSLGIGLLAFILSFPIFFIVILLSIVLVLVLSLLRLPELTLISGLTAAVFDLSAMGLFYFTAFLISRVIVALALGRFIIRRLYGNDTNGRALIVSLLLGVVILALFASLPVVGWLVSAVAAFLGLGAVLTLLQEVLEKTRVEARPVVVTDSVEARAVPPPTMEDELHEPGTENLPEGFKWWD
jgi:cytoskeletal protein CcmA (bactofilin family)